MSKLDYIAGYLACDYDVNFRKRLGESKRDADLAVAGCLAFIIFCTPPPRFLIRNGEWLSSLYDDRLQMICMLFKI